MYHKSNTEVLSTVPEAGEDVLSSLAVTADKGRVVVSKMPALFLLEIAAGNDDGPATLHGGWSPLIADRAASLLYVVASMSSTQRAVHCTTTATNRLWRSSRLQSFGEIRSTVASARCIHVIESYVIAQQPSYRYLGPATSKPARTTSPSFSRFSRKNLLRSVVLCCTDLRDLRYQDAL